MDPAKRRLLAIATGVTFVAWSAVILLGLIDIGLLIFAGDFAWRLRSTQIGSLPGPTFDRIGQLSGFAAIILTAMIAVGVYGADALRSMRFATARLLVAVSLGIILLSFVDFILGGHNFWRSTLAYAMAGSVLMLVMNRLLVGGAQDRGGHQSEQRGADDGAQRLAELVVGHAEPRDGDAGPAGRGEQGQQHTQLERI